MFHTPATYSTEVTGVGGLNCVCMRATGVTEDVENMPSGENGKKHKVLGLASRVSGEELILIRKCLNGDKKLIINLVRKNPAV